ncbi:hypothetical protein ACFSTA_16320 [Ornithinibacillus salinisoli]|uniref:Uncharacterized protein n=1 Tax=Ornithinibacillus salinisoli TaxID=1848459 RepID=A0ABW4W3B1_9BACI
MKIFLYQIIAIGVIWIGMAIFYSEMSDMSRTIFYVVTSWLLFLIVLFVKQVLKNRKEK